MSRLNLARKASRSQLKARVAIDGPSGAGKTYTAIEWATILQGDGGRTLVVDTEHGSAEWYSDRWDYDVLTWAPPYAPAELADTLRDAAANYEVVVVDSFSHFWEGEGGTRDVADAAAERHGGGNSFAGWKVATPQLRHLIDTVLALPSHVICTMRSKMEYVLEQDARGKMVPRKVGLAPVMRQGVEYEFTLIADLDLEHRFIVTKSRCSALADVVMQPHRAGDAARQFLDWLDSGERPIAEHEAQAIVDVLNGATGDVRKAWRSQFNVSPVALPESRLDEAKAFVASIAGDQVERPPAPAEQADQADDVDPQVEAPAEQSQAEADEPDPQVEAPAEQVEARPDTAAPARRTAPAFNAAAVARRANEVFRAAYDAAPRGAKTRTVDRLRHALVHACTNGEASSLSEIDRDGQALSRVWNRLDDLAHGRLRYRLDGDAVTFTLQNGDEVTVRDADLDQPGQVPAPGNTATVDVDPAPAEAGSVTS